MLVSNSRCPRFGDETIYSVPLYRDALSKMEYFFTVLPLEYIHHDDRINPRPIGSNIRSLIVEFLRQRPQLHVGLAWWAPEEDGTGRIRMFDGQHKAAAQILIGSRRIPVRVFVEPDLKNLSGTVFGAKQNREFWTQVFKAGRSSSGVQIFASRIDVIDMMRE